MEQTSYNYEALTGMKAIQEFCRTIGPGSSEASVMSMKPQISINTAFPIWRLKGVAS